MKSKIGFKNTLHFKHCDPDGAVIREWDAVGHNQTQNDTLTAVRCMLYEDDAANAQIFGMGIGTGDVDTSKASDNLHTLVSAETCGTAEMTETDADTLTAVVTFTAKGSWTIKEAGLFGLDATCDSDMLFCYCDAHAGETLSEVLTAEDTLQVTWTIDFADA